MAASALMQATGQHKKNARVLERILAALGEMGAEQALPTLLDHLKDNDGKVAAAAARALGSLKSPASVDPLLKTLERLERDNKLSSETNPGGVGGNQGMDEAKKSLRERYSLVAPAIKDALKSITGENLSFIEDWQEWWGKNRATFGRQKKEEGEKK
jgi:HEAT repeat protein